MLLLDEITPGEIERFWRCVTKTEGGCWEWNKARTKKGYGNLVIPRGGRTERKFHNLQAHRLSWMLAHGQITAEQCVLHLCDNPPCCNPAHLFLGTRRDNNEDMDRKGRRCVGSRSPHAKIGESGAEEVRRRHAAGESFHQLGRAFGVNWASIRAVVRREAYRHVP